MNPTHHPPTGVDLTPAQVLRDAATYLLRHGWYQHGFYNLTTDEPFPPACALGAIDAVVYGTPTTITTPPHLLTRQAGDTAAAARQLLADYLDPAADSALTSPTDIVGDFNDEPDRTLTDIIGTLHAAADDWDKTHTPASPGGDR